MATPLTVCLVVLGKHVPGLEFLGTLLSDSPPLTPEKSYYQRLLARDQAEAAEIVERYVKAQPESSVYDAMLIPALNFAERDRLEDRLSADEETAVIETTRELLEVCSAGSRRLPSRWLRPGRSRPPCVCWDIRPTARRMNSRSGCSRRC